MSRRFAFLPLLPLLVGCEGMKPGWLSAHREEAEQRWQNARANVRLELAEKQLNSGQFASAEAELARVATDDPQHPGLRLTQARLAVARGQFSQAEPMLRELTAQTPANPEAFYLLGATLQQANQLDEAIDAYINAATLEPANHEYQLAVAECQLSAARAGEALEWLEQARRSAGLLENPDYHRLLGQCYRLAGDDAQAVQAYEMAVMLGADDPLTQKELAFLYVGLGDYASALLWLEPLLRKEEPESDVLTMAAARCYLETGQPQKARTKLALYVRSTGDPLGWMLLAEATARCGDATAAVANAQRAVAADPNSTAALQLLAGLAVQIDDLRMARQAAQNALRLGPDDPLNYCLLADVTRRQGHFVEAARLFSEALELDPDCAPAQRALERLRNRS